jgi:hypothetical protein
MDAEGHEQAGEELTQRLGDATVLEFGGTELVDLVPGELEVPVSTGTLGVGMGSGREVVTGD